MATRPHHDDDYIPYRQAPINSLTGQIAKVRRDLSDSLDENAHADLARDQRIADLSDRLNVLEWASIVLCLLFVVMAVAFSVAVGWLPRPWGV